MNQNTIEQIVEAMYPDPDRKDFMADRQATYMRRDAIVEFATLLAPFVPQWARVEGAIIKPGKYLVRWDGYTNLNNEYIDKKTEPYPATYSELEDGRLVFHHSKGFFVRQPDEYQPLPSNTSPFEQLLHSLKNKKDGK